MGKEKEERRAPVKVISEQDEIPLFYTDLMPLLVRVFLFPVHAVQYTDRALVLRKTNNFL